MGSIFQYNYMVLDMCENIRHCSLQSSSVANVPNEPKSVSCYPQVVNIKLSLLDSMTSSVGTYVRILPSFSVVEAEQNDGLIWLIETMCKLESM